MRLSKDDLEKLLSIIDRVVEIFGRIRIVENIRGYIKSLISGFSQVDRTVLSRVKLRISNEIDKLSSADELKPEERVRLKTLEEVIEIIKEEENKKDIYDIIMHS